MSEIASRLTHPTIASLEAEQGEGAAHSSDAQSSAAENSFTASDALDLTFEKFDVERVFAKAGIFLSSSGVGWHLEPGLATNAERLAEAKASSKRLLGTELGSEAGAMSVANM